MGNLKMKFNKMIILFVLFDIIINMFSTNVEKKQQKISKFDEMMKKKENSLKEINKKLKNNLMNNKQISKKQILKKEDEIEEDEKMFNLKEKQKLKNVNDK